ncbi:hypothetical protein C8Q78DRAFT_1082107 [Trametes maxima]|nr:hypothetical protein C8Q78DRAFT_1082107 [Trametes maxima]
MPAHEPGSWLGAEYKPEYGIQREDLSPRPAYSSVRPFLSHESDAPPRVPPTPTLTHPHRHPHITPTLAAMRLSLFSTCAALLGAASLIVAAPIAMPLPLWLAANSNSARAPNAGADPLALPWGVQR